MDKGVLIFFQEVLNFQNNHFIISILSNSVSLKLKNYTEVRKMEYFERRIDELGRVVIPIDYRGALGWKKGDTMILRINATTGELILRKKESISPKKVRIKRK